MGVQLSRVRIKNFRSIESMEIELGNNTILIGQNNSGKSNFLRAIDIAINSNRMVSEQDIYVTHDEILAKDKVSIIDIMIKPVDEQGKFDVHFSEFWTSVFTVDWITTDDIAGDFVGIRTVIEYDLKSNQYIVSKMHIMQWNNSADEAVCSKKQWFTADMQSYMVCFYMDAHRDILDDLKTKKSYFGLSTSNQEMPLAFARDIEKEIADINDRLIRNTPALVNAQMALSEIGTMIGTDKSELKIEPINRSLKDLNRGIDIKISDKNGPTLSVSEQGIGTRSWISFLTLGTYIEFLDKMYKEDDAESELFAVLALEEPEAHLHSFAQKKLFSQIEKFSGQKIISTHSSNIISQASVLDIVHLDKRNGKTILSKINKSQYNEEEIAKIHREFIHSKGDLLFSTAIIFAEGITEELALPVYYKQYFQNDPNADGVAILGIGGQNYKTFLHLVQDFHIHWFIFSDGEQATINTLKKAIQSIGGTDIADYHNIVIIDNGDDYEKYLVHSGYGQNMIDAINKYEKELRSEKDPVGLELDPRNYFNVYMEDNNHKPLKPEKTKEKCPECGQYKIKPRYRDYDGEVGQQQALIDCCKQDKAKYAYLVAEEIVNNSANENKIPEKMRKLFVEVGKVLKGGESLEN